MTNLDHYFYYDEEIGGFVGVRYLGDVEMVKLGVHRREGVEFSED